MISIIIPVYNEEKMLKERRGYFSVISKEAELIFVDGGSSDHSVEWVSGLGHLIRSVKNRAFQMNEGAKAAKNDILLFLHVDSKIEPEAIRSMESLMRDGKYAGGCFRQVIDQVGLLYRWIAWTGNIRARVTKIFYGDQGIFVRKNIFDSMQGYPKTDLAEDVLFSKKLKKFGRVKVMEHPILCSSRRWIRQGIVKTFVLNMRISLCLLFGLKIDRFAKCYHDIR